VTALRTRPRLLSGADAFAVADLIRQDPVLNCVLDARLAAAPDLQSSRFGGPIWGLDDESENRAAGLRAAIFHGGNLIPLGNDIEALTSIADVLAVHGRGCSSIVGPARSVSAIWPALTRGWGRPRIVRDNQPFMVTDRAPDIVPDENVRRVRTDEIEALLPAAIAMFTEELHTSPLGRDSGAAYRARVLDLVASRRSFARFDEQGRVVFKAEVGALGSESAQIQGVWVRPELRGRGLGTAAMAQCIVLALEMAPSVSLYVNEFNLPARRMYDRLGMRQTETLSTILF
jgi:uncharacterized protein